jgi:hypothetical protein
MIKKIINFHKIKLMIFNNILQWTVIMLHNFIELIIIKEEKFINSIKKSNLSTVTKLMIDKKYNKSNKNLKVSKFSSNNLCQVQ